MKNIRINEDLFPETAREFLLEWYRDIPKEDCDKFLNSNDLFVGNPKSNNKNDFGIYKKVKLLPVDYNLTPENAGNKGLIWVADMIYDPEAPEGAMDNLFEMLNSGYKFGEPASINSMSNGAVGVFKPLKK